MAKTIGERKMQLGYLQICSAAIIWGTYGLFVRALDYSPEHILFYRFLFGFAGLLVFASIKDGLVSLKPALAHWKWMIIPALLTGLSWLAYTYSLLFTSVANAVFLIYTAPVFTVLFAPLMLKEKLELRSIAALVVSLLGTAAIMGYSTLFSTGASLLGDIIALLGGMTYGFLALFLKRAPRIILGFPSNVMLSGYITLALFPLIITSLGQFSWRGILILLALGLFQQSFGATLFHLGLQNVKAQHAGILTYIEPLAATLMAALFLYEGLTWGSILGGFLIMVGGMIIVLIRDPEKVVEKPSPRHF